MRKMTILASSAVFAVALSVIASSVTAAPLTGPGTCTISVPATAPTTPVSGLVAASGCSAASKAAINSANWVTIYNQGAATMCAGFTTSVAGVNDVDRECWPILTLTERSFPFGSNLVYLRSTSGSLTVSVMTGNGQ